MAEGNGGVGAEVIVDIELYAPAWQLGVMTSS